MINADQEFVKTVILFDPTAPRGEAGAESSRAALAGLSGAVVGFIDNAKPNFDHLVDDLAELLVSRYGVRRVVKRRKPSASVPARPELVEQLAGECDMVIAGSGD
jgi:hypothetical protein